MWLIFNDAFLSVVDFDKGKDSQKRDNPDNQLLLARARRREDLERCFERAGVVAEIEDRAGADYSFGAVITRTDLKTVLAAQIDDIDYTNFKNSVKENDRHSVYSSCWAVLNKLQARAPWSGGKAWGTYRADTYPVGTYPATLSDLVGRGTSNTDNPFGALTDDDDFDPRPRGGGHSVSSGGSTRYGDDDFDYLDRLEVAWSDDNDRPDDTDPVDSVEARFNELPGATGYKYSGQPTDKAFNDGLTQGYEQGAVAAFSLDEDGAGYDVGFEDGYAAGETEGYQSGYRNGYRTGAFDETAQAAQSPTKRATAKGAKTPAGKGGRTRRSVRRASSAA